ncbi:hypothetical protein HBI81_139890 [Parastagonospora nodorum]|nr:hypothetical protein HBH51_095790 [Parastagonospora nodorum]KAH4064696.1 hypothetical protein HBH50_174370 [Parastagonospora nodorum]KAH4083878.1 hypothetical protein HBH48_171970 [Parastagonospora nodorum]KAH4118900.1 hypothetical protein HBH47_133680 [Parastagonospora nodorum]KAH4186405.1 hypothetical protein HBH42_165620 [Parastagonospora nodorum]
MAFDWSFPSLLSDAFDTQNLHFDDIPSLNDFQQLNQGSLSIERTNPYPPDLRPFDDAWAGLGCTCGSFFTCSEHNDYDLDNSHEKNSSAVTEHVPSTDANANHAHSAPPSQTGTDAVNNVEHDTVSRQPTTLDQESVVPRKVGRTKISSHQKRILRHTIATNVYPSAEDIQALSDHTGLSSKMIATWFSNQRSRKFKKQLSRQKCHIALADTKKARVSTRNLSHMSTVSSASLRALDRLSPASSVSSLEKFLSTPMTEDVASASAIQLALHGSNSSLSGMPRYSHAPHGMNSYSTAASESSISSMNSFTSCNSQVSIDSRGSRKGRKLLRVNRIVKSTRIDSYPAGNHAKVSIPSSQTSSSSQSEYPGYVDHDSDDPGWGQTLYRDDMVRKIRKRSTRVKHSKENHTDNNSDCPQHSGESARVSDDESAATPGREVYNVAAEVPVYGHRNCTHDTHARTLFCTWPDCDSRFRYRFDWSRHEEAVHYVPYHWICCMEETFGIDSHCVLCRGENHTTIDHCSSCRRKELESRTFYREDQLVQHIKRVHRHKDALTVRVTKDLLSLWKCDNPSLSAASLYCGFCGESFGFWAERQNHVFEHLVKGACKSLWWPERQPELSGLLRKTVFSCPTCNLKFDDFISATQVHGVCISWSCRCYHEDTSDAQIPIRATCSLCNLSPCALGTKGYDKGHVTLGEQTLHSNHELGGCAQDIFIDAEEFAHHLERGHSVLDHTSLDAWQRVQFLEIIDGRGLIRTSRFTCPSRNCCQATQPCYNFTFVTL